MGIGLFGGLRVDAVWADDAVPVVRTESVKAIEEAPNSGTLNPQHAWITRRILKQSEATEVMSFEVVLKMRALPELHERVAHGEHISPDEMAAKV